MITKVILAYLLGYISAHVVRILIIHRTSNVVDPIENALEEFKKLEKEEIGLGEIINVNKVELKMKEAKGNLTLDDLVEENNEN